MGRSTRLGFKVVNGSPSPRPVELLIDWQYHEAPPKDVPRFTGVEEYMSYRDFVVVRGPGETAWRTVMADVEDSVGRVRLSVAPGETEIHWHPPYTYTQGEQFVESLRGHPLVRVEKLGESDEGRNLWLLRITDDSPRAKKPALFYARLPRLRERRQLRHGRDGPLAAQRRAVRRGGRAPVRLPRDPHDESRRRVPRPGQAHRPARGRPAVPHAGHVAACSRPSKRAIDRVRPALFIDLHNWQNKHTDGLLFLEPAVQRAVRPLHARPAPVRQAVDDSRARRRRRRSRRRRSWPGCIASGCTTRWR